jgi:hypothetical protein
MKGNNSIGIRAFLLLGGIAFLALTIGFFFQMPWATNLWPWPVGRLSYIFIASITAAVAVPNIWIGLSGESGAAKGGAINLGAAALGSSAYLFLLYFRDREPQILTTAVVFAVLLPIAVVIFRWSKNNPIRDTRAMPDPVKISFLVFTSVLIVTGTLLVQQRPVIFPWPLKPESSVIFGFIFLGAALYFANALFEPKWHNARGHLLGFLAYDLILIGPYISHLNTVKDAHRLSLIIYISVLLYSGGLAVYYLFINKITRTWKIKEG